MDKNRASRYHRVSRNVTKSLSVTIFLTGFLLVQSCDRGLSHLVRRDIEWEKNDWQTASRNLDATVKLVEAAITTSPELFREVPVAEQWRSKLRDAKDKLSGSERYDRKLTEFSSLDRESSQTEVERLLKEARSLREAAVAEAKTVEANVSKWQFISVDPQGAIAKMNENLRSIQASDFRTPSQTVGKAGTDWPGKRDDLERRLAALKDLEKSAQATWDETQEAREQIARGKLTGSGIATLISADDSLTQDRALLTSGTQQLIELSGQLYNSWDKILADLERSHFGRDNIYRERIKTIRTHLIDPATNRSEVTDEEHWISVPEQTYRSVENDIGMTLAHKDAGFYDSEAQQRPQPPGFAYLSPIEVGSNRYGYWTHSGGQTFWTFLPQYLILREILRSHDYRPIYLDEYRGYSAAKAAGRTYYGPSLSPNTASRAPTYGTHGSFTAKNYANSRYVQSGGFRGSAYASNRDHTGYSALGSSRRTEPHSSFTPNSSGSGKRFGTGASPSSGRRFGRSGGVGRSFGRRR